MPKNAWLASKLGSAKPPVSDLEREAREVRKCPNDTNFELSTCDGM